MSEKIGCRTLFYNDPLEVGGASSVQLKKIRCCTLFYNDPLEVGGASSVQLVSHLRKVGHCLCTCAVQLSTGGRPEKTFGRGAGGSGDVQGDLGTEDQGESCHVLLCHSYLAILTAHVISTRSYEVICIGIQGGCPQGTRVSYWNPGGCPQGTQVWDWVREIQGGVVPFLPCHVAKGNTSGDYRASPGCP
jgi:hypothetical protein